MARTILIVDDNAIDRTALKGLLEEKYTITEADNDTEIISILREKSALLNAVNVDSLFGQEPPETEVTVARLKTLFENINGGVSVVIYEDNGAVRLAYANDCYYKLLGYSDITDMVEAQQKLATQHERMVELLNDTPSGIAIVEFDPSDMAGTLHIVYYNDRFFSYSGYTRDEYHNVFKNNEMAFVFQEDIPILGDAAKKLCDGDIGTSADTTVRCYTKDGGFRWLLLTGQLTERRGKICVINVVMVDVTRRKEAVEHQRISEEMLRIAAETDQRSMIVYDVKNNTCRAESRTLFSARYGDVFENIPQSLIDMGLTSPDSEDTLCSLFARIKEGENKITVSLQLHSGPDKYEWFECNATTVLDADGLPDHAVLVFHNITEQRIKEAVFKKWKQSIAARPVESYTLFRCNLSKDASLDEQDGELLKISFPADAMSFNSRTKLYAEEFVHPDDREGYVKLLDEDTLLAMFYRGDHFATLDYREIDANGEPSWRHLTIEMVEYPNCADVQAFLMYEDIDEKKKTEIEAIELAKSDPLTGALNRSAFVGAVDEMICENPNLHAALIMLDMDGFKQINDTFGHSVGDQALQEVTAVLRSFSRQGDLVCRLGGDEFLVWLRDVPYDAVIGKIVQQMCEHIRKAYSYEVLLSASVGIAVYPRDGQSYDDLYPKADKALYKVKQSGKGSYAFFSAIKEEQTTEITEALSEVKPSPQSPRGTKRRMLIVDDNKTNRTILENIFKDEYIIEIAKNGAEAMIRLRHFRDSISVVLLDLLMPGVDGFAVLKKVQNDIDLRTIPVVIVTGDDNRETLLKAFDLGAAEYVTKPVDADIIRMRVKAVISKTENERLRAQNSYLMLQRDEEVKYHTVLESTGTAVVEYDWRNHVYIYDNEISKHIAGKFDHRGLWQIFLSDMVSDSADVKNLQDTLINLGSNRKRDRDSKLVKLKTPEGFKHWFRVNFYKSVDDFGLTDKLIITFNNVQDDVLASDKLLFQATRDDLTGLYNRAGFLEKAAELIASREPGYYVMACIDVEKFKVINDRYGTEKGDEVLRHIATSVGGFVTRNNGICCRYTADKFALLYPAKLLDTAELAENHIVASSPDCIPRPLRLCIGRCMVNDSSLSVNAIFDRAAMAESLAKDRYDTYIIDYDESMRDNILKEQQIVGDMVDALKNGEFEPWFQPQYNHDTGALIGAEALVRWRKNGKIIPPNDFIPVFEKNGFIYEVDQYIWRRVCAMLRRWLDECKNPLPVSVNISRYDLFQESFMDVIMGLVAEYRLPTELLRLEITESAFSADANTITDIAGKLISSGFTVEIDDFGSGYSSLNTLKDVPASILKLDMRFFERTGDTKRSGNIVESVVRMAKWLGMAVIAEGVEDMAQADYLKSIGCFYIQGYLYAKPMPVEEYEKRFETSAKEVQLIHLQTIQNLDNNDFWDSRSMDTLIFNSYVGAACILECHNGKIEMIRATDTFLTMLGTTSMNVRDVLKLDWETYMDTDNISRFNNAVNKSVETKKTVSEELVFTGVPGCQNKIYLITGVRAIATVGDRILVYCLNNNITEQRIAEQQRFESVRKLEVIMSNVNGGVSAIMVHDDGTSEFVFNNNKYYELYGYTREQAKVENLDVMRLILPEDIDSVMEKIKKLKQDKQPVIIDYSIRKRDGSLALLRANASLMSLPGYGDDVITSVITDVTEKRSLEDQLRAIVDNIYGAVTATYIDKDGQPQFVVVNDQFFRILGYTTRDEYEAEHPDKYTGLHPDDRERIINQFETSDGGKTQYTMDYRIVRKDGVIRHIRNNISVIHMFGIDSPVQLSVANDITKEREAEIGKSKALDRLNTVMNTMTNGMTAVAFHDNGMEFLFANNRFYEIYGIKVGDIGTDKLADALNYITPEYREKVRNAIREAVRNMKTISMEYQMQRTNGIMRWINVTINITKLSGIDAPVMVAVLTDITEQKKTSEQLCFLNESAGEILAQPDSEKAINKTLRKLQDYFTSERAYIFELNDEKQTSDNTYEICAPGITSEMERLQGVPYDTQQYWFDLFDTEGFVAIPDIAAITKKSEIAMRDLLLVQNIHSIIVAPLRRDNKLIGYIGIDNPTRALDQVSQLIALTDYIAVLLTRRDLMKSVEYGRQSVQQLIDDTPGGFLRLRILPDNTPVIVSYNTGFCRMLGMTGDEVMAEYGNDAHKCIVYEDVATVKNAGIEALADNGLYTYQCRLKKKDGTIIWVQVFGRFVKEENGEMFRNSFFTDVTEQQEERERLRLAEEEYRIAIEHSARTICRYNIPDRALKIKHDTATRHSLPVVMHGVPYAQVEDGSISSDTSKKYIEFYEGIHNGDKVSACVFCIKLNNRWRWLSAHSTSVFDNSGKPLSAIISFVDITEAQEKELVYKKWEQSLTERKSEQFTLYRCNLNKDSSYDTKEGTLFGFAVENKEDKLFNECTAEFCSQYVVEDDRSKYIEFLDSDRLLANYYRGDRSGELIFRAMLSACDIRWIHLSVELLEYPDSTDVEAYLMYEDINDSVLEELHIKKLAETDSLTGLQNRKIFIERVNGLLSQNAKDSCCALFLLDIDCFKQINDSFGHRVGDESIVSMADVILSVIREDGFVCRLGGDEFLVCLPDMPSCDAVADKARELCEAAHITIKHDIQISVSIGVALVTDEGENFDSMYHKADKALYHVKGHGKNNFAFYENDMERDDNEVMFDAISDYLINLADGKNTMLIVDDSAINRLVTGRIFKKDFSIVEAEDGQVALDYLREHIDEVAIVLLDIMMPVMDGYQLLEVMKADLKLQEVPVIVISGEDDRKASLQAIKAGASEYIVKPIDAELIRLRVSSVLSKVENARLHKQNNDYALDSQELHSYRSLMESNSTVLIEYFTKAGVFKYAPQTTNYLNGTFDERPIWQIFAEDRIASEADIKTMHKMITESDKPCKATINLMTPDGTAHPFLMGVIMREASGNDDTVLITLTDRK